MKTAKPTITVPFITLPPGSSSAPLHRQLYEGLRRAILSGQLGAAARLPSTRALAAQMGVARMTVVNAYEQLLAEGYIEGKVGSGSYVAATLPDEMLRARDDDGRRRAVSSEPGRRALSRRGQLLVSTTDITFGAQAEIRPRAFQLGLPAVDEFPFAVWSKLTANRLRRPPGELLVYGDPAGYWPLREAVSAYLKAARAVRCDPDQVVIVAGSQQALDLTARVLLDPDDVAWIENPCYPRARDVLLSAGARVVPLTVDDEGIDLSAGLKRRKQARLVYVTPSHQFPLGVTMSLARRLALIEWAQRHSAWIIEDDYNSEYRYAGRPLASLQGLDQNGRVIYIGSFSKTIFPGLRLGCMVVPPDLVDAFSAARALADWHSPSIEQAALADFIAEGHFARHVRRMRALYQERQEILLSAARRDLAGLLDVTAAEAGMHLVGWLPEKLSDRVASERAAAVGIDAPPLSAFCTEPITRGGLLLGYAAVNARQIRDGVRRLAAAFV